MSLKSLFQIDFNNISYSNDFYSIYKGKDEINKNPVIIKKIKFKNDFNEKMINDEIKNIRLLNLSFNSHHYINHYIEDHNLFIIFENYECNLDNFIKDKKFSIEDIQDIISQLNNSFKLLYDKNLFHLNINSSTILIKKENNKNIYLLSGFGFQKIKQKYLINETPSEDLFYIPPEIQLNLSNNLNKADLWSIGILLYYLYFNKFPFQNNKEYLNFISNKNNTKLKINSNNEDLNDLIENLLICDPCKRISWEDYFNHKFFNNGFSRIYYDNYEIEFEGFFKNYKKYKGKEYDLYGNLEFEGEYDNNENRWTGKIKEYNKYGYLKFDGFYSNGNKIGKKYNKKGVLILDGECDKDGKKIKGKEYSNNNGKLIFEGDYKEGIRWNGEGIEITKLIDFEGKYINGIRIGKEYYDNGKLKFEGDRNGKGIEYYYKSSEILFEGNFRNNCRWNGKGKEIDIIEGNGKGFEFDKYGKLQFEGEYKDGKKWKGKEYYEDEENKIHFEGEYKDGKKWKGKVYDRYGDLVFDGEYKKIYYYNRLMKKQLYFKRQRYKSSVDIVDINNWKDGIIFDNDNNKGNGFGKKYDDNYLIFEGEFKNYKRLKGKEYDSYYKNFIFEGEYKNNLRWKGKIFDEFEGEIRNGNKKFYIYIPFIKNKKDYRIYKININDNNEKIYFANMDDVKFILIKEIPKYKYNIELIKKYLEIYKLLISEIKFETFIELFDYKDNYYIVVENYNESLKKFIDKFKVKLPNELIYQIIIIFYNIIKYFDEKKLIFNFLNPENFLYNEKKLENINIILNFNYFLNKCLFDYNEPKLIKNKNNIYDYNAPELYIPDNKNITNKINIWSLGILIYEMLFHQYPNIKYKRQLKENNILSDLIIKMLEIDPEKRISYNYILEMPFFKQIINDDNKNADLKLNIFLIGNDYVGCNSIAGSLAYNIPFLSNVATSCLSFRQKTIYKNNLKIHLNIWNSCGKDMYWGITNIFLKKNKGLVLLVYEINNYAIDTLINRYNKIEDKKDLIFCICRNKIDIINYNISSLNEEKKIEEFRLKNKINFYFKISCKTYEGIEEMINKLIDYYLKMYHYNNENENENNENIENENNENENNEKENNEKENNEKENNKNENNKNENNKNRNNKNKNNKNGKCLII